MILAVMIAVSTTVVEIAIITARIILHLIILSLLGDSITLRNKSLESVNRLPEWNTHVPVALMNSLLVKP